MNSQLAIAVRELGGEPKPDNASYECRIQIRSRSSSRLYIVARNKRTKRWECDCLGWKRWHGRSPDYQCDHLKEMVPALTARGAA